MKFALSLITALFLATSAYGQAQTAVQGESTTDTATLAPTTPLGVTAVPQASSDGMGFIFLTNDFIIADVNALVNVLLGKSEEPQPKYLRRDDGIYAVRADANRDGQISIADVTFMVNKMLNK